MSEKWAVCWEIISKMCEDEETFEGSNAKQRADAFAAKKRKDSDVHSVYVVQRR